MKDAPSHMMKFMRKMSKKPIQKEVEDESYQKKYRKTVISKQNKQKVKKRKTLVKKSKKKQIPENLTPDEQNRLMEERIPRIRERSHKREIHIYKK